MISRAVAIFVPSLVDTSTVEADIGARNRLDTPTGRAYCWRVSISPAHPLDELAFTVSGRIARPVAEVYEAVADPARLSRYFTTGGAKGRLDAGADVTWDFHDFPGAFPVDVLETDPPRRIVIRWTAAAAATAADGKTTVTFEFAPIDDGTRTLVTITESAWLATAEGA
jgi:uncharacterized protein YndB with AHSA1/START domain